MAPEFITVSVAETLTGKSERTIRRFLQANVDKYPEHFEIETQSGRKIWLIESAFLAKRYPLVGRGESDTMSSRDNAGQNVHGSKTLQQEWQKSKQIQRDSDQETEGDSSEKTIGDHDGRRDNGVSGVSHGELWELVKDLRDQVKEKDKQLDRYFTNQQDMMEKMGTLMEQGNYLLAQSQSATIGNQDTKTSPVASGVVDAEVKADHVETKPVKTPKKNKSTKEKKQSKKPTSKQSDSKKTKTPEKKSWWDVFRAS
ncbi:MAG: hypothetical protein AAFN77_03075 [Planctomycetota bacterium]